MIPPIYQTKQDRMSKDDQKDNYYENKSGKRFLAAARHLHSRGTKVNWKLYR